MFYVSEKEYNIKMQKLKARNESRKRELALKEEKKKYAKKMSTSNKVLLTSIMAVVIFTIACLCIQCVAGVSINDTLITLWYSFWSVEIVSLAGIKVSKVIKNKDEDTSASG